VEELGDFVSVIAPEALGRISRVTNVSAAFRLAIHTEDGGLEHSRMLRQEWS